MNSRERVHKILNHEEADRPAIDLGSTRMTGTSAWTYRALKKALGMATETVRVYDLFQMLAQVETPVLILPEVPVKNILALYRVAWEYRYPSSR